MTGRHDGPPPLTVAQRIVQAEIVRRGRSGAYRALRADAGERHTIREDLLPGAAHRWRARAVHRRPLLTLAHVTDLQVADVQSPVRFEFLNREFTDPRFAELLPVQRPQEALTPHAVLAMVETLNRIPGGPVGGAPPALAVTTGDAIDNAQWNELRAVLALLDGGLAHLGQDAGGDGTSPGYQGVQSVSWPDEAFWCPDGAADDGTADWFRDLFGFPHLPGVLEQALRPLRSPGLRMPWLACYGNHEALVQGVGTITPQLAAALVGDRKPVRMPPGMDPDHALGTFVAGAHAFLDGPVRTVAPDAARRPVSRREFVSTHLEAAPDGHGFTAENVRLDTAYYVRDLPGVRLIGLDTTRVTGGSNGAVDTDQLWWLQARLMEVHSRFRAPDGTAIATTSPDRLVVLFSHHGSDALTNLRRAPADGAEPRPAGVPEEEDAELVGGAELLELLHRFPNVVLWLNGHTHTNAVRARTDPQDPSAGLWEVTTCAVVDWPCQSRLVELLDLGDGTMAVACTMVDHDTLPEHGAPLEGSALGSGQLAALHRELAANVPLAGAGSGLEGTAADRNVVLPLRAPFDLSRLPSA